MWLHSEIGARILGGFRLFGPGAAIVRHHHESFDGTGYPDGLAEEAIPLGARVVAVADALDAMTSDRPYRRALSVDEALSRFREGSGHQWDPAVISAMLVLVEGGRLDLGASRPADAQEHDHDHDGVEVDHDHDGVEADHDHDGGDAEHDHAEAGAPVSHHPDGSAPDVGTTERPAA